MKALSYFRRVYRKPSFPSLGVTRSATIITQTRHFSTNTQSMHDEISGIHTREELFFFMKMSGNSLSKEDLVLVLESIAKLSEVQGADKKSEVKIDKDLNALRDRTLKGIFNYPLQEYPPLYMASLINSMVKIEANDVAHWRLIEKLLSREDFFEQI